MYKADTEDRVPRDGAGNLTLVEIGNLTLVEHQRHHAVLGVAAVLGAAIVLAAATVLALVAAACAAAGGARVMSPGEARIGSLLLREGDHYVEAPLLGTDIDITVVGPTARARLTQIFNNPTDGWVEAVYVYPLPDGGAVDTLKMVVGDRIIVGDIKERAQARRSTSRHGATARRPA